MQVNLSDLSEKQEAILEAALALFIEKGFHGTPTSLIAKEANVATGTLFHYFKTKEILISSLWYSIKVDLGQNMIRDFQEDGSLETNIRSIWKNSINWGLENPLKFRFLEQFSASPYIKKVPVSESSKNRKQLYELINEDMEKGILRKTPVDLVVRMVYYAMKGVVMQLLEGEKTNDKDSIIDESFNLVWNGIAK